MKTSVGRWIRQAAAVGLAVAVMAPAQGATAGPVGPAGMHPQQTFGSGHLQACNIEIGEQNTNSSSYVSLAACTLRVDVPGHMLVLATDSVGPGTDNAAGYQAAFSLSHNAGLTGDPATERHIDNYPDADLIADGNGSERVVSISGYYTVTAGTHTFTLLYRRVSGSDDVGVGTGALSVLFIPDGTDLQTCGVNSTALWTTTSSSYSDTVKCSLTFTKPGRVWASADGWLGLILGSSPPYEAAHRVSQDGGPGLLRYTNVYTNTGDGVDMPLAAMNVFTATAGTHTYSLMQSRYSNTGTVRLLNAGLVVLYVPFDSPYAVTCGAVAGTLFSTTSSSFSAAASCALPVPDDSWVFAAGNLNCYLSNNSYDAGFALAHDNTSQVGASSYRFGTAYPDSSDGLDATLTTNEVFSTTRGLHNLYLIGKRYAGTGTVAARTPMIFALAPGASVYVPVSLGP
jgi:hypothetical protein